MRPYTLTHQTPARAGTQPANGTGITHPLNGGRHTTAFGTHQHQENTLPATHTHTRRIPTPRRKPRTRGHGRAAMMLASTIQFTNTHPNTHHTHTPTTPPPTPHQTPAQRPAPDTVLGERRVTGPAAGPEHQRQHTPPPTTTQPPRAGVPHSRTPETRRKAERRGVRRACSLRTQQCADNPHTHRPAPTPGGASNTGQ